jgi:hypothetical protein
MSAIVCQALFHKPSGEYAKWLGELIGFESVAMATEYKLLALNRFQRVRMFTQWTDDVD